jgi:hypothetical protein
MRKICCAFALFLLINQVAWAATFVGTVASSVADSPLVDADILVNGAATTKTNLNGQFQIEAVEHSVIRAAKDGYIGISVLAGVADETFSFKLAPIWQLDSTEQVFTDVPHDAWFAEPVKTLYEQQILSANELKPFHPGDALTRAELAYFAVRTAGFLPPAITKIGFCDTDPTAWYAPAAEFMRAQSWIGGFNTDSLACEGDKDFRGGQVVNRAEAVKMVLGVFGDLVTRKLAAQTCPEPNFIDLEPAAWFYPFVRDATCLGLVSGYPNGTFQPGKAVNRAEIAGILANVLKNLR